MTLAQTTLAQTTLATTLARLTLALMTLAQMTPAQMTPQMLQHSRARLSTRVLALACQHSLGISTPKSLAPHTSMHFLAC